MLLKIMSESSIQTNLKNIITRIEKAYQKRPPDLGDVTPQLIAVSKTKPPEMIVEAYAAGQRHFGENYVNELVEKANHSVILENCKDIQWHFIGNLQANKINKLLPLPNLHMIETVDEEKLATKLNTNWPKFNTSNSKLNIMIQVNTSGEEAKNGISPNNVIDLAKYIRENCDNLHLHGLMTIGQFGYDLSQGPNPDFILLRQCRDNVCKELNINQNELHLSMGMSDDFEHAIELGSTMVRVGSSIFGQRDKKT